MLELTQWWKSTAFSPKPWLILGKGPSFGLHEKFDLSKYNCLSLNHVVREVPVDVAHVIDVDVVEDCGEDLLRNCRWLLMPRYPHVNFQPSDEPLESWIQKSHTLKRLDDEGRLVWYQLSSGQPIDNSPKIQATYFSSEAAIDLLGTLGVRTIRSLGVDGGRGYSEKFDDLQTKTMLANGHATFNRQFAEMDVIIDRHGIDYEPLVEPFRIFSGTDESQRVAARVMEFSIKQHTSHPVNFQPMFDLQFPTPQNPANRPRTGFSFFRFAIPKLCGNRGRALYVDADMQVFTDIAELWDIPFGQQKVLCTNQPEAPQAWKHDNSFFHPGRQMSVMLLDCERLDWDVERIIQGLDAGQFDYRQLMFELCLVAPEEIEDRIPPEWNCLEWFEPAKSRLLHYTVVPTQPWKNDENPLRHVWEECYRDAVDAGAVQCAEVLHGIELGFLKPSLANAFTAQQKSAAREALYVEWNNPGPLPKPSLRNRLGQVKRGVQKAARKSIELAGKAARIARGNPGHVATKEFVAARREILNSQDVAGQMIALTDRELQDFQEAVDWKTGMQLPDGRVLGIDGKRGKLTIGIDPRVELFEQMFESADKRVLEVGCCEGIHTVQLARVCQHVTALEVRPKNIVGTLVRAFVHDTDNVKVKLADARDLNGDDEQFDAVFHVGVLYHLMDPVEHLCKLGELADRLLLDTHVCLDDTTFERSDETYNGKTYRSYVYGSEAGWRDMFSGLEPESRWLHVDALQEALRDAGFDDVNLIEQRIERNGPRVTIIAQRSAVEAKQAA